MQYCLALLSAGVCCILLAGCVEQKTGEPIAVRDAWIREPPPRSPAAGYLVIENRGENSVELIAAETQAAGRTEIHIMEHKDNRMTYLDTKQNFETRCGLTSSSAAHLQQDILRPAKQAFNCAR